MVGASAAEHRGSGDFSSGDKKKKGEKKGFKVDRYERYQQMQSKKKGGNDARKNAKSTGRVKSIVFDESARREFLLGMHKRKNERRVKAFVDAKQKLRRENAKVRRAQREEARQSYNRYAKVPILPNFTYKLPSEEEVVDTMDESDTMQQSVHVIPASMTGERAAGAGAALSAGNGASRLDDDLVTVAVRPLFGDGPGALSGAAGGGGGGGGKGRGRAAAAPLPANDFSDLPQAVEEEMRRLKQETKGPARTKARLHMLKELQKIQKIKKYSRKGHGKKTAKGKRRNR